MYQIKWQEGTEKDFGKNGPQIIDVLEACLLQLKTLNQDVSCRENSITITKIEEAIMYQEKRTRDRLTRNVEGTHQK